MNTTPRAKVHAFLLGRGTGWDHRGRVWVESIGPGNNATVRYDCDDGRRSRAYDVPLSMLDFSTPDGWRKLAGDN